MKTGLNLDDFVAETERQAKTKRDFKAPSPALSMHEARLESPPLSPQGFPMRFNLQVGNVGEFPVRQTAHTQIATRLKIPMNYYERMMKEDGGILSANVNHWLRAQAEHRMVRTIDGQARAYLSDKYRPLDNFDLLRVVRPVLEEAPGMRFESVAITEDKFYVKAFTDKIEGEVKVGEPVQAGVLIQNSEVGQGSLRIEPMILVLRCLNGAVVQAAGMRRFHVGRGEEELEEAAEFFTDATRRAEDEAFWRKVVDVARASFDEVQFGRILEKYRQATKTAIPRDVSLDDVVEITQSRYGLSDGERDSVLKNLINGHDLTQWGLSNAITATSQDDALSYDRASDLERFGGQVLELNQKQWGEALKN